MKSVKKEKLPELFQALKNDFQIFAPMKIGKSTGFSLYGEGRNIILDKNTEVSPKGLFFAPMEKMYGFAIKGQEVSIDETKVEVKKKILFGIRSCDAKGLLDMDKVFLTRGFEDEFYKNRREETLVFALACNTPNDTCFCQSMSLDPHKAEGADVQMYDNGAALCFQAETEAGEEFLRIHDVLFEVAPEVALAPMEQKISVDVEGVSEKMEGMFEDPMWAKLSRSCIRCSTCAYLCPTCYCFDLTNKIRGEKGSKFRTWDCCMFEDYSLMAGGHNPRPSQINRVRNRMMDKLVYNRKRHGEVFCVGCGRCIAKCPVNIDITSVIRKVKEGE